MVKIRKQECHLCQKKKEGKITVCSVQRCSLVFCFECIKKTFNKNFLESQYREQYWICYACGKKCNCNLCKGVLPDAKKKVIKKPTIKKKSFQNNSKIDESDRIEVTKMEEVVNKAEKVHRDTYNVILFPTKYEINDETDNQSEKLIQNKNLYRKFQLLNFI